MAAHGHDQAAHAHDAHDDFDPEPATQLSPGEPTSPAWLPVLGICLFLAGGIWFLARGGDDKNGAAPSASAAASAAAAPAAPPRPAGSASARPPGQSPNQMLDREQRKAIQDRIDKMRQQGSAAPRAQ
jgi:hypothetical protein